MAIQSHLLVYFCKLCILADLIKAGGTVLFAFSQVRVTVLTIKSLTGYKNIMMRGSNWDGIFCRDDQKRLVIEFLKRNVIISVNLQKVYNKWKQRNYSHWFQNVESWHMGQVFTIIIIVGYKCINRYKYDKGKPVEKRGRKAAGLRRKRYDSRAAMIIKRKQS